MMFLLLINLIISYNIHNELFIYQIYIKFKSNLFKFDTFDINLKHIKLIICLLNDFQIFKFEFEYFLFNQFIQKTVLSKNHAPDYL